MLVERLIAAGHPDPWSYSPRQAAAYAQLAARRARTDLRDGYLIARAAHHADEKADKGIREALDG